MLNLHCYQLCLILLYIYLQVWGRILGREVPPVYPACWQRSWRQQSHYCSGGNGSCPVPNVSHHHWIFTSLKVSNVAKHMHPFYRLCHCSCLIQYKCALTDVKKRTTAVRRMRRLDFSQCTEVKEKQSKSNILYTVHCRKKAMPRKYA